MTIHLIRHGKTLANEQRLYCGATDLPLSDNGITQLAELKAQNVYPASANQYFTSGLQRTTQTLNLLYGPVKSKPLPQLMEFNFGSFEMKSYDMLKDQDDYQAWITDEGGQVCCPNGENKEIFTRRVINGYKLLKDSAMEGSVLAVVHGGVIVSIMEYLFPNTRNFYEWQPKPGRGYTLIFKTGAHITYEPI